MMLNTIYMIRHVPTGRLWSAGQWCRVGRAYTRRSDCVSALRNLLRSTPAEEIEVVFYDVIDPCAVPPDTFLETGEQSCPQCKKR
jgi:hypothetical protein